MGKNKIGILNLGCPRNLVDAENILGRLNAKGYEIVDIDKAQVAIINTCAFIDDAKKESVDAILGLISLKKEGKLKKIIVAGCLAQRYRQKLKKQLPEIDAFVGTIALNHSTKRFPITPKHYAYLKICEGCLNNCSYCSIPSIKGKFTSLEVDALLDKAAVFNTEKISELNIIGQDISGFGMDLYGQRKLPELVYKIAKKAGSIGWIRLLYLYPDKIINELIEVIKDEPRICRYFDLPVQHISNRILKLMNRRITRNDILGLIRRIRKNIPDAAIRTSLIVGFPSETDKEFNELLEFMEEVRFERLGAFIYSREENTRAYSFKRQVLEKTKIERFNILMSLQQKISKDNNNKFLGKVIDVLIEQRKSGYYLGRSQYDAPEVDGLVYVNTTKNIRIGEFVKVKITDTLEYDLTGHVV